MKDSLVKNYLYDISYRVVIMLLPLILTPYISRVIGPEGLGIYGFTSSIITLFCVLSELGSATYAVNCVAKSRVDRQELLRVYKELRLFRVLAVVVCYILLILFIVFYSRYSMIFWINSIILIADAFDVSWYLEGIESFKILSTRNIFIRLCSAIAIFVFVKGKDDLALYVTILSSASLDRKSVV